MNIIIEKTAGDQLSMTSILHHEKEIESFDASRKLQSRAEL